MAASVSWSCGSLRMGSLWSINNQSELFFCTQRIFCVPTQVLDRQYVLAYEWEIILCVTYWFICVRQQQHGIRSFSSSQRKIGLACTEAEFLDEIQTKVLRVFLLTIHSHLYRFVLRFLFLQTHTTSYGFYSSVIHCKRERRKTWQKTLPTSLWVKKSIQKPQVWKLSKLCRETSMKLYGHEFGFCTGTLQLPYFAYA
jgi:hypothetical protein